MVLYKRKQVLIVVPSELPPDLLTEVWVIPQTKEWFLTYEEYLERMDYYQRRKFVCEITGNSCLTFFEALQSETQEVKDVEKNFPEALKGHILRFLQFNRITRLDQLVDKVYLHFKNNYFPGEYVLLKNVYISSGAEEINCLRRKGLIREKVEPVGSPTKYLVVRLADEQQAIATGDQLVRDRNHFTKWLIKTFIKLTMARSHKIGAPWVVKDKFAKRYRIEQDYPPDLQQYAATTPTHDGLDDTDPSLMRHFTVVTAVPKTNGIKIQEYNGKKRGPKTILPSISSLPSIKLEGSFPLSNKPTVDSILDSKPHISPSPVIKTESHIKFPIHYLPENLKHNPNVHGEGVNANKQSSLTTLQTWGIPPTKRNMASDLLIKFDIQNSKPVPYKFELPKNSREWNDHLLELIESKEASDAKEAEDTGKFDSVASESDLNSATDDNEDDHDSSLLALEKDKLGLTHLYAIESALESWIFMNIYHTPLKIDTFTFDDFVYCMGWNYDQFTEVGRCELLDEIWCSILGAIVSSRLPNAAEVKAYKDSTDVFGLQFKIPTTDSFLNPSKSGDSELVHGSESDSENNEKSLSDAEDESDSEGEAKKRSYKLKQKDVEQTKTEENGDADDEQEGDEEEENDDEDGEEEEEEEDDEPRDHNAYSIMNHRNTPWHDRLRKRNFRDGNWQTILLGVLSLIDDHPKYQQTVQKVFKLMAPLELPATAATALNQFYKRMDINTRLEVLNILCELLSTSNLVRGYIDESLEESTNLRRRRLENIKEFKSALEQAHRIHNEIFDRYLELTDNVNNEEAQRKRPKFEPTNMELTELEKEFSEKDEKIAKLCDERKELFENIDALKKEKKSFERDLVERDCQRVRCLGKDRLFNRYWWFENNGVPTLHGNAEAGEDNEEEKIDEEDESGDEVHEETYLMGRLWVQGPQAADAKIHFDAESYAEHRTDVGHSNIIKNIVDDKTVAVFEDNTLQKLDFSKFPQEFVEFAEKDFGLKFEKHSIHQVSDPQNVLVDHYGEVKVPFQTLSPLERKLIEECPDPLLNGSTWRFYDKKEDIEELVKWLNPYGVRESQLKKELNNVKEAIFSSIDSKNKALSNEESLETQEKIKSKIKLVDEKIANFNGYESEEDEDDIVIKSNRKRSLRSKPKPNKRSKTFDEIIQAGTVDELEDLKTKLEEELVEAEEERELSRALEWVNSTAVEFFDKSLYDGGDKPKPRGRK